MFMLNGSGRNLRLPGPPSSPSPWLFSPPSSKKHVITIICVVNLVAGRKGIVAVVMVMADVRPRPASQTSGLVMGPASISASFRPRPSFRPLPPLAIFRTQTATLYLQKEIDFRQPSTSEVQRQPSVQLVLLPGNSLN